MGPGRQASGSMFGRTVSRLTIEVFGRYVGCGSVAWARGHGGGRLSSTAEKVHGRVGFWWFLVVDRLSG